ncbi:MAG: hypothetical protein ACYC4Q_06280 [Victivallaceae bacterium]
MGTASLVIGIIAIIFGFIPLLNYFLLFPALLGLVLGIIDIAIKVKHNLPRSESICGVVLNGLAIFVIAAWTVVIALIISNSGDQIQKMQPMIQNQINRLQQQRAAYVSDMQYPAAKGKEDEE